MPVSLKNTDYTESRPAKRKLVEALKDKLEVAQAPKAEEEPKTDELEPTDDDNGNDENGEPEEHGNETGEKKPRRRKKRK